MHAPSRSSLVFAGITIAAVSAASGWIGGVMVTRAQVMAIVDRLPPADGGSPGSLGPEHVRFVPSVRLQPDDDGAASTGRAWRGGSSDPPEARRQAGLKTRLYTGPYLMPSTCFARNR
jgi:hypothetical protein